MQRAKQQRHSMLPPGCQLAMGKENQLTSTPLPAASSSSCSTRTRTGAGRGTPLLRDLSNILSPLQMTTPTSHSQVKAATVYASTLPTFEAEYSPSYSYNCSYSSRITEHNNNNNKIIPGPLLALRGMGIPDSYFEKPRYLEQQQQQEQQEQELKQIPLPLNHAPTESTLSSSQMGDVTLERMIDAILESTRKPPGAGAGGGGRRGVGGVGGGGRIRSRARSQRPQQRLISTGVTHSPTYRPAFDPASDLCEYWQSSPAAAPSSNPHPDVYEEREVRSPQPGSGSGSGLGIGGQGKRRSLQLRRQRVVRRKRKITTKISSSVRQSAQKLLAAASRSAHKLPPRSSSHTQSHTHSKSQSRSKQRHISPDSGHNSTSDCELEEELGLGLGLGSGLGDEELEASCKLDAMWMHNEARDATKRRLSFSLTDDS
ncbi:uncharacterized protein LOC117794135 [Drosophila innubila]|uniref:uncharacterized protein LOC117794135 n=1 Tax=Drosophila innubila TaxID=198719 RepID=UPI00148CB89B|nr:uncharacterized protein LOC117794135 [Drosophila innubila]